jgi:integrase
MNVATDTRTRTAAPQGPAILRPRDVKALLAAPDRRTRLGRRDSALLAVLVGGGLRIGEAVRLVIDNIEFAGATVRVTTKTSKGRAGSPPRYRTVTLPPMAGRLVRDYVDHDAPRFWVFPGRHGEFLGTSAARRAVTKHLRAIGRGDLHCHSCRHSVGAQLTRATGNLWLVAKVLGHQSVNTTMHFYSQYSVEDSDKAADALAGVWSPRNGKGLR